MSRSSHARATAAPAKTKPSLGEQIKAAATHPTVVNYASNTAKAVGIVAGLGVAAGAMAFIADKTYAALAT